VRVFPPPTVIQALGQDFEPLLLALAQHQIDRLPWPYASVTEQDRTMLTH
jgi:hypothetical protein